VVKGTFVVACNALCSEDNFSFALMQKRQKIKPEYFYPKIIGQIALSRP
jgi:hypothetical protein